MVVGVILPVVPYGSETWSLTLREEHRLRAFENRVLKRIFGPKTVEKTRDCRKFHNWDLHNLHSLQIIIRKIKPRNMRWALYVGRMKEKRNAYEV
jgi:hypothetical protein